MYNLHEVTPVWAQDWVDMYIRNQMYIYFHGADNNNKNNGCFISLLLVCTSLVLNLMLSFETQLPAFQLS